MNKRLWGNVFDQPMVGVLADHSNEMRLARTPNHEKKITRRFRSSRTSLTCAYLTGKLVLL